MAARRQSTANGAGVDLRSMPFYHMAFARRHRAWLSAPSRPTQLRLRAVAGRTVEFDRLFGGALHGVQQARPVITPSPDRGTLAPLVSPGGDPRKENLFADVFHTREGLVSQVGPWAGRRRQGRDSRGRRGGRSNRRDGARSGIIDWRRRRVGAALASP